MTAQRTYQPLWEQLKQQHLLHVECAPQYRNRIRKAVKKERDMDNVFCALFPNARIYWTAIPTGWRVQLVTHISTGAI